MTLFIWNKPGSTIRIQPKPTSSKTTVRLFSLHMNTL